mmetsp:Transcript_956/g.1170  ORF Transcript_956/g.1170 Transcript_956/m.1170 type:complete len:249 (-) Transcript_956:1058-1804(-)|eukprot:CAMPEP_0184061830 /NCGR_PEP_ID=MMETSP0956-20121227/11754_1 /TAXON_ID=627963 /ORGANISM="Aplanochytrium sp, Strain PBS07" /LENGTH=248 /DNA_ID=CAMNT_0026358417 /DNA_START=82 /DNA_END=828 /DNA_ORIENTATION=-
MKSVAGIISCIALFSSAVAQEANVYSWVPSPHCYMAEKFQICYEGDKDEIAFVAAIDPANLCTYMGGADVVKGKCSDYGFKSFLAMDPIFRQVALYRKLASDIQVGMDFQPLANEGVCWKDVDFRGVGRVSRKENCTASEEWQFGLCYKKCPSGTSGTGPLCLRDCTEKYPFSEAFICCTTKNKCLELTLKEGLDFGKEIAKIIVDSNVNPANLPRDILKLLGELRELKFPQCSNAPAMKEYKKMVEM